MALFPNEVVETWQVNGDGTGKVHDFSRTLRDNPAWIEDDLSVDRAVKLAGNVQKWTGAADLLRAGYKTLVGRFPVRLPSRPDGGQLVYDEVHIAFEPPLPNRDQALHLAEAVGNWAMNNAAGRSPDPRQLAPKAFASK